MFHALFWRRLGIAVSCALLMMMSLPLMMSPRTAFAQTATAADAGLSIERVWTRDGNGNDKTTFVPSDALQYTTLIRNTYDHSVKMKIHFEAGGPTWAGDAGPNPAFRFIYSYTQENVNVPPGRSGYYSPWTIPTSAKPGSYYASVGIGWSDDSGGYVQTQGSGLFDIPGILATSMKTYLLDSQGNSTDEITSASGNVANGVGPGGGLEYRITVTNTSSANTTGVILTDPLPREIFDLIGTATTDHGTCDKTGSWPSIKVSCQLGSLASHETATVSMKASILVRSPDGTPFPPKGITNKVSVNSDQQPTSSIAASLVRTALTPLSDNDFNAFKETAKACLGVVSPLGFLAGFTDTLITGTEKTLLTKAAKLAKESGEETLVVMLNQIGIDSGLPRNLVPHIADVAQCVIALHDGGYIDF